jgi:EAL domain-containing protein (putative c-di-GMP-specific phosphodiesterase class I)
VSTLKTRVLELRNRGYRIAIDDIGSGYAGLASFALLEPDFIKLDTALVRGVEDSLTKRKLIWSLLAVCRELGIQVVAEGIETPAELDTLVDLGCDLLQGYLLARPGVPPPDVDFGRLAGSLRPRPS